jgi:pectinesterase
MDQNKILFMKKSLNLLRKTGTIITVFLCMCFILPQRKTTIYMICDSTMANKQPKAFPETGWGMAFGQFFDQSVVIDNRAMNGRSTKSFITENRWQPVIDNLKEGDYVFIEFGHNDEKIDKPSVGTSLTEFRTNLIKFVTETRAKRAIPVLLTPTMRRSFKGGVFTDTHGNYPDAVRSLADSMQVALIDMHRKTEKLLTGLGDEPSKALFNYVDSGNVNYPEGKKDDTHFSPAGAKQMAALAVDGIKELKFELAKHVIAQ